jgi:asparagine synthase (glutamine-hydrolysing)
MAGTLTHRGPDDEGFWADPSGAIQLGFRRLSIQDLSAAGHQPMVSRSGRYTLCFNGEVYNFEALRSELGDRAGPYRGHSDTEVMLAAFEAWGVEAAVRRFQGMFAFAVHDAEESCLWLARDRVGIKPLYVASGPDWVVFGSELRALLEHPRVEARGSTEGAWHYLRSLYVPTPHSIIEGVEKIRPGHLVRVEIGALGVTGRREQPYWDLFEVAEAGTQGAAFDDVEALDRLHELLRSAVGMRLVADVPVGALLSGGIDSSLVVAIASELSDRPIKTFTIRFGDPDFDEGPIAAAVGAALGTDHTEVALSPDRIEELVPETAQFSDEPMANPSLLPTLLVSRVAREQVVVALSGDGGDELFGGYNRYRLFPPVLEKTRRFPGALRRPIGSVASRLAGIPAVDGLGRLALRGRLGSQHSFAARLRRAAAILSADTGGQAYREFMSVGHLVPPIAGSPRGRVSDVEPFDRFSGSVFDRMLLQDQLEYLPDDLLAKVDRASMWASLEARVPLLDHRVVEFSWGVPAEWKVRDGVSKWPLRQLVERYLDPELLDRPKMGFTVPLERWLREDLRDWVGDLLNPDTLKRRGLYDVREVVRARDAFLSGAPGLELGIWSLALLEDWCRARGVTFD